MTSHNKSATANNPHTGLFAVFCNVNIFPLKFRILSNFQKYFAQKAKGEK